MSLTTEQTWEYVRTVAVYRQSVRVKIRPGTDRVGAPLVLCNGIGASLEALDALVEEVDRRRTVIRFDVPGVGSSPPTPLPYTFPAMARLVVRMVESLGYRDFDILGFSWGGALAQQTAMQHPHRVRRVVLVSTGTGAVALPGKWEALSSMLTPRRYRDPSYARQIAPKLYGGTIRDNPDLVLEHLSSSTRAAGTKGYRYQLIAGAIWSSLPFLKLLRQPTLLLFGDDDPIIPLAQGRMMAKMIPNSQLVVYPGGHLAILTEASRLVPRIDQFLDSADPRDDGEGETELG